MASCWLCRGRLVRARAPCWPWRPEFWRRTRALSGSRITILRACRHRRCPMFAATLAICRLSPCSSRTRPFWRTSCSPWPSAVSRLIRLRQTRAKPWPWWLIRPGKTARPDPYPRASSAWSRSRAPWWGPHHWSWSMSRLRAWAEMIVMESSGLSCGPASGVALSCAPPPIPASPRCWWMQVAGRFTWKAGASPARQPSVSCLRRSIFLKWTWEP